jgi:hypothetical protein
MKRILALLIVSMGFAATAQAAYIPATWTDTINFTNTTLSDASRDTRRVIYTHDITDEGFRPLIDEINLDHSFDLSLWLADDGDADGEKARIDLTFGLGLNYFTTTSFGLVGAEFGGYSLVGWAQLNYLGSLTITIASLGGDFNVLSSQLTAYGSRHTVPEPGTLALLGIGLLGMAFSLRRRPAKH